MAQKLYSWLRANSFRLTIASAPEVAFTCQTVNLSSIRAGSAQQPTPFVDIPRIGDKLTHSNLFVSFIVAEDLSNYDEIYRWLIGINFPQNYDQFGSYIKDEDNELRKALRSNEDIVVCSDINVGILDSDNNLKVDVLYKDCFPIGLSEMQLSAIEEDNAQYLVCTAEFKYNFFTYEVYA